LDKSIQNISILINRTPAIMEPTIDLKEYLVEVPSIAGSRRSAAYAVSVGLTELKAPFSDGFITKGDSANGHHLFDIRGSSERTENMTKRNG